MTRAFSITAGDALWSRALERDACGVDGRRWRSRGGGLRAEALAGAIERCLALAGFAA